MPADPHPERASSPATRRTFLRKTALTAIAAPIVATLASCDTRGEAPKNVSATPADSDHSGGTTAPHAAPATAAATIAAKADEMDALHEKGVKAFPAKTEGKGGQLLAPRMEGGVKVFDLTCKVVQWEVEPGRRVEAWTYNGQLPGPEIRVREGDRVRFNVKNELPESTVVHFHGLYVPNNQDGVPYLTQPPIKPGQSFTYEFTVRNAGSHMYHSHHNAAMQVGKGLLGALVVEPRNAADEPKVDVDYVMILNDGAHGYTINGKGFPATEPITVKKGQRVRVRYMNEGMMIHPMHLHGMPMQVIAKDGWKQPAPWLCDTLNIGPGERWDVLIEATEVGAWAFHCHILPHAETPHGMFGMVTAMIVQA
ncbi:MAG TPA: multicopper oxidase domain-containing protein [Gemmatimonadaceae bacterium]|jgi:FtsP/CotA-like multicopper oxidase with cupredoxin domain|nr:multicopper oxidase domain-containing protein [Gemmatimonadaceae bacterium]